MCAVCSRSGSPRAFWSKSSEVSPASAESVCVATMQIDDIQTLPGTLFLAPFRFRSAGSAAQWALETPRQSPPRKRR